MTASTETVSLVPLADPATLGEVEAQAPDPLVAPDPPVAAKPKRVRAKAAPRVKVQASRAPEVLAPEVLAPEVLAPEVLVPEVLVPEAPEAPPLTPPKKKRAPRPPKMQTARAPVEIIEPEEDSEEEPQLPLEPQYNDDFVLEHLLNHRVRQRVQREAMYKSFV